MTPEARQKLKNLLISHENFRQFPYSDITGHLTIGIGRNLTDRGISMGEALSLLEDDISYFSMKLNRYLVFFSKLDDIRQIVLIDMCFNMGVNNFLGFRSMIDAIEESNWDKASDEMLKSEWANQVKGRAIQLAQMMRTGEYLC